MKRTIKKRRYNPYWAYEAFKKSLVARALTGKEYEREVKEYCKKAGI